MLGVRLGRRSGWRACRKAYRAQHANIVQQRAQLEIERELVWSQWRAVEKAASDAIDSIDAMHGAAQVQAVLSKWGLER
jgi:hypothetical protein